VQCTTSKVLPTLNLVQCSGAKVDGCLTTGLSDAIVKMDAGPVTPLGKRPSTNEVGRGIAGCTSVADGNAPWRNQHCNQLRSWKIGSYQANLATAKTNALDFTGGVRSMVRALAGGSENVNVPEAAHCFGS
jgi:feruloyl esterase